MAVIYYNIDSRINDAEFKVKNILKFTIRCPKLTADLLSLRIKSRLLELVFKKKIIHPGFKIIVFQLYYKFYYILSICTCFKLIGYIS